MAHRVDAQWEFSPDAPTTRERKGGRYAAYIPDCLNARPLSVTPTLGAKAARLESSVRALLDGPGAHGLEGLARFLLRSEAIASSRIEGLEASPQQIALAELAQTEDQVRGFSENARLVANNIAALREAATELAAAPLITIEGVESLHRALLPAERHHGLRTVQNWIGGSDWSPIDADFVPPPPHEVRPLMVDLVEYTNSGLHAPLVQAALAHAQFETIHPFTDGNGRVGRALIHTILTRRGLTKAAVLPVSLVLFTWSQAYVGGLTAYRYDGSPDSIDAREGVSGWLSLFFDAVEVAVQQAERFASELLLLRQEWTRRSREHRESRGIRHQPRADSAVARLLDLLPEAPLVTARTVQRLLDVSFPAARAAVEELADAGILARKQVERGTTGYLARDVFEQITFAERRLASTRWDTRLARPGRAVPAAPR